MEFEYIETILHAKLNGANVSLNHSAMDGRVRPYIQTNPVTAGIFIFLAIVVMSIGVFGNIIAIVSIVTTKGLRELCNLFIISLAAADISVTGLVLPFNIAGIVLGEQYFLERSSICVFLAAVCSVACAASFVNIGFLVLNRMILMLYPKQFRKIFTKVTTPLLCLFAWCCAFGILALPNLIGFGSLEYDRKVLYCLTDIDYWPFSMLILSVLLATVIIIVIAFVKIYLTAIEKHRQLEFVLSPSISLAGIVGKTNISSKRVNELKKDLENTIMSARMVFVLFLLSFFCWGLWLIVICTPLHARRYPPELFLFASFLAHTQGAFDAMCYPSVNKYFRTAYKRILCTVITFGKRMKYAGIQQNDTV